MTYLIINILIILVPLGLSFEKNLKYYKNFFYLLFSLAIVSTFFIIWDHFATIRGDWSFSESHIIGLKFFSLPLEEILFFITVPYSIIFTYETFNHYFPTKTFNFSINLRWILSFIIFIASFFVIELNYTFTVTLFAALFFLIAAITKSDSLNKTNFWITLLVSYVPFTIVNYLLTSIPIVTYNDSENLAIRLLTIPIEDTLYSFAMVSLWILFYDMAKQFVKKSK